MGDSPAVPRLARLDRALEAVEAALGTPTRAGDPVVLAGPVGGATGFALAALGGRVRQPLLVIVPDGLRAALLADAIGAFSGRPDGAVVYPAYDHLPYQGMSPPHRVVAERMAILTRLAAGDLPDALVVPAAALGDRVPPREVIAKATIELIVGNSYERSVLLKQLVDTGHVRVPQADDVGAFAVRGDIIDVFPAGLSDPLRLEFFDDMLESIRPFDAHTQQTRPLDRSPALRALRIGPVRDLFFTNETTDLVRMRLQRLADVRGTPSSRVRAIHADLENRIISAGFEDLMPAFFDRLDTFFAALDAGAGPGGWCVAIEAPERVAERLETRWNDLVARSERAIATAGELVFAADAGHVPAAEIASELKRRAALHVTPHRVFSGRADNPPIFLETHDHQGLRRAIEGALAADELEVLQPLVDRLEAWHRAGACVVLCAPTPGGIERLRALLAAYPLDLQVHEGVVDVRLLVGRPHEGKRPRVHLVVAHPGEGFDWSTDGLVVLDHTEILGKPPAPRRRIRRPPPELAIQTWRDLKVGDLVVHLERGVGRYIGLDTYVAPPTDALFQARPTAGGAPSPPGGIRSDLIVLEYAGGDRLYVPIEKLHLVSKHQGGSDAPALDRLGGPGWQKTKARVTKAVRDIADKLLRIQAEREARRGVAFNPPDDLFRRFEAAFPFDETPDQARAIDEVLSDLQRSRPMDRLVCGDVGFGKTEVAMRAAMKVVCDGWQVAVVVPTQVLAEQHRRSFLRRFEGFPILIESLVGAQAMKSQKDVVADLEAGRVDIVIGTHRLLSRDVRFKRLGLLIIDEEHRFGVAQKERLRELRPTVDVLTLSATPIPRTLHMSMVGLRDISLIQTPPTDRLPVQTFVAQTNDEVITEAMRTELLRGGQVFYVHHRVMDIAKQAELLMRLVPEARVVVAHGQMPPGELDAAMARFASGEANVLVATTIIESGIDIPTANTIIINRADCFGLAQLHQLRGRVGRSDVRAYCFLLIPSPGSLVGEAEQRILAIQRFSDLGSGFAIANHDLDIRGSGDILGADQAGNINAVGFETYTQLLQEAIAALRESGRDIGDAPRPDPELRVAVEARIPERWLPDVQLRLRLYRRFAAAESNDELAAIVGESVDRYGAAPEEVMALADVMRLKLIARQLHLKSVTVSAQGVALGLTGHRPFDAATLARLVTQHADWRLTPDGALTIPLANGAATRGRAGIASAIEALLRADHSAMAPPPPPAAGNRTTQDPRHEASSSAPRARAAQRDPLVPDRDRLRQGHGTDVSQRPGRRIIDVDPTPRRSGRRSDR
jgi:transcription-repair coupling factor (superfamily II helicase)